MAEQRLEQAAEKTMAIVRSIAGHPDVSVEEAGEILLLAGQRLESARAMSGLNQFSPAEIESAKQFISSLEPAARSKADGFETVQKVLDHYQQMINFTQADEAIIQQVLEGSGLSYSEARAVKVGRFIRQLGYEPSTNHADYQWSSPFWHTPLTNNLYLAVGKPKQSEITTYQNWLGQKKELIRKFDPTLIGRIIFGDNFNDQWLFEVEGFENRNEAIVISKYIRDNFDRDIKITVSKE